MDYLHFESLMMSPQKVNFRGEMSSALLCGKPDLRTCMGLYSGENRAF